MKEKTCMDCGLMCGKRSARCKSCSNKINGKSRPRHTGLCKQCGAELAKRKYTYCQSCNMKNRWSNDDYASSTTKSMRDSFDVRWADPTARTKMVKVLTTFGGSSKLEKSVAKIASQYDFDHSVVVGRYLADLLNENKKIIVEVNGDLWHCNPAFWKADDIHPNKKISAKEIWDKDLKRKEYLESLGYKVFVLWENDILKNKNIPKFFEDLINDRAT